MLENHFVQGDGISTEITILKILIYSLRSYAMRSILFRLDPTHRLWLMSELRLKTAVLYGGQE